MENLQLIVLTWTNVVLLGIVIYFVLVIEPVNKQIKKDLPERPAPNIGVALFAFLVGFLEIMSLFTTIAKASIDISTCGGFGASPSPYVSPAPTDDPSGANSSASSTPAPPGTCLYQVRPGDTLTRISEHYGTTVDVLLWLNPEIKDKNLIYTGQEISVPCLP